MESSRLLKASALISVACMLGAGVASVPAAASPDGWITNVSGGLILIGHSCDFYEKPAGFGMDIWMRCCEYWTDAYGQERVNCWDVFFTHIPGVMEPGDVEVHSAAVAAGLVVNPHTASVRPTVSVST